MNRIIIGISGCSASGKSFIVKYILDNLGEDIVSVLYQDNYYKKREQQVKDDKGNYNFDLPTSFHIDQLIDDIKKIKNGEVVIRNEYTFNNPDVIPKKIIVKPRPIVLVEGLFLFDNSDLSSLFDKKIFIDSKIDTMIDRRIKRDYKIRGYDKDDVIYKFKNHVIPAYKKYIFPHKDYSDLIVNNNINQLQGAETTLDYIKKDYVLNNK
ncbi:MAG: uridine kinase [Cytophagia bacterium]|nr:uridine kinase [Cytophagia bacterium]